MSSLNYKQKRIFLGMAKKILVIDDGVIDDQEESYLRSICGEMSLGLDDEISYKNEELKNIYTSQEEARLVLVELIALAYSNNKYDKNQKKFIQDITNIFQLNVNILKEIEETVKMYFEIQKKIIAFIAPQET